jgi:hypothetical protein
MQITRNPLYTGRGPSDRFTGTVHIDTIATPSEASAIRTARLRGPHGIGSFERIRTGLIGDSSDSLRCGSGDAGRVPSGEGRA